MDNFFGNECDDDENHIQSAEFRQMRSTLYSQGYRAGRQRAQENASQLCFDQGFEMGLEIGQKCGALYGNIIIECFRQQIKLSNSFRMWLQRKIFKEIPMAPSIEDSKILYDEVRVELHRHQINISGINFFVG